MSRWDPLIQQYGQQYNVDPRLIAAVVQVESGGDPKAYNSEFGATGLTQIIPETAKALGVDPRTPEGAIEGAAKLLDQNLTRYGNAEQAILAYHGGIDQRNWGPKTQNYLRKINEAYGGAPVAQTKEAPVPDEFTARFGPRPSATAATQAAPADDAASAFAARFGQRPATVPATVATEPAKSASQVPISATVPATPATPGIIDTAAGLLGQLGEQGIKNANSVGRGIMDALDAPSEWLASGAEQSGLTGLLGKAGINMPTYEQQVQQNAASRAQYAAANPDAGVQDFVSRMGGNIIGVGGPLAGVEAGLVKGGQALSSALGNPQALNAVGGFLRGQGGLTSRMTYNAAQGGAAGALLSGGQPQGNTGDDAALGAALGAAVPVAGAGLRYVRDAGKALAAPFSASGRQGIAANTIRGEANKDPLNLGQIEIKAPAPRTGDEAVDAVTAAAERVSAEDAIARAAAGGRIAANFNEIIPGSTPTLAQATGNAGVAALERAAMSRSPNAFSERQLANYSARNAYMTEIKGTPETLNAAVARRDAEALPFLKQALDNARPANATKVVEEIDSILAGRAGQRDDVVRALDKVKGKIDLGHKDGMSLGLETRVEQLYGIRQSINDQLAVVAGRDNSAAQLASKELIQVRQKLDDAIQEAAPGFKEFLGKYAELSKPVDAQKYLQALDLTDQTSQRITLNKVKSALNRIEKLRSANGANEAKSISDSQLDMLRNLQADLQREAHSSRGMAIGSNTFQNFATNNLIESMLPGKLGAIAPVTPGGIGGALGYALGGNVGAGIGAIGGQQAAGIASRAMNAQGPEIEARLIDYLLNPRGVEMLAPRPGSASPTLERLLRRSSPAAPASITSGAPGGNNN